MKAFIAWLGLIYCWWNVADIHSHYYSGWSYFFSLFDSDHQSWQAMFLLTTWLVIAMWWCHENLGWFGGYESASDVPRMAVHPRYDKF